MKAMIWILTAMLGSAGCDGSMMSDADQMRSMVADVRQESDTHVAAVRAAESLLRVGEEMGRHEAVMEDMMGMMDRGMDGMSHCAGPAMQDLRDMHDGMGGEMDEHAATMRNAMDLGAVTSEVTRHADAMAGMLDGMDEASGRMACM